MRETLKTAVTEVRSANGTVHGMLSPSPDPPFAGFTAVNGFKPKVAERKAADNAAPVVPSSERSSVYNSTPVAPQYHTHGWRPAETTPLQTDTGTQQRESSVTGKRKRSEQAHSHTADNAESVVLSRERDDSPKRRLTTLDSAVDLTSPGNTLPVNSLEANDDDGLERERPLPREKTPVERWNQGEPPPKPRPETEASLAASLHQFQQQNQLAYQAQQARNISPDDESPPEDGEDAEDDVETNGYQDAQSYGDLSDPKKRKRNFSNRTKTGCHTCRKRKKKCDEGKPTCQNCDRGGHTCEGYGPKPPADLNKQNAGPSRPVVPLQSKAPMPPYNGRPNDVASIADDGLSYSHWGRVPPPPPPPEPDPPKQYNPLAPVGPPRPNTAESWRKSAYPPREPPPPAYQNDRLPPPDFAQVPPIRPQYSTDPRHHAPQPPHFPPPRQHTPHQQHPPLHYTPQPAPPAPMPVEPWGPQHHSMPPYQPQNGPPSHLSSRDSVHSGSHRSGGLSMSHPSGNTQVEKDKMLRGQPFLHYLDGVLLQDRRQCKAAVERYNKAAETTSGISGHERSKYFTQILKPHKRPDYKLRDSPHSGPAGTIEDHTIVESPFRCDYGYNIHIGKDCVIESGAYFQDAADIYIGSRVIMGPNVKLYCITASIDPSARKGSQGNVVAGAIRIEDDVFVGADVTVLPCVTIGGGAVIGAGSVVTKDVEEHTVVAGNPARFIRRIEGPSMARHHSQQVQKQQDNMQNWMVGYANSGFSWYSSPRL